MVKMKETQLKTDFGHISVLITFFLDNPILTHTHMHFLRNRKIIGEL